MTELRTTATLCSSERVIGGTTVLALRGEVDLLTAQALSGRLDTLTAAPRPDLVLDLRSLSFIDCAGLGVLCRAHNRTVARGGQLRLVTGAPGFLRILHHARLGDVFEIHTRLSNALPTRPESGGSTATAG